MRFFSSLWYWILLAVFWSVSSYKVLGVPFDMILRAEREAGREQGDTQYDLEQIVRIKLKRLHASSTPFGTLKVSGLFFLLVSLFLLGFWYGFEFAQAIFLFIFPLLVSAMMARNCARAIHRNALAGPALIKRLKQHRFQVQILGMIALFITSLWGMYQNLHLGVL